MPIKLTLAPAQLGITNPALQACTFDIELTSEQEKQISLQGGICDDNGNAPHPTPPQPVDICQRINSWKDAANIVNPAWTISEGGYAYYDEEADRTDIDVPTERHAKSMLAFAQLSVIAAAYNSHAEEGNILFSVIRDSFSGLLTTANDSSWLTFPLIHFYIEAHRDDCLEKFEQLWKDYWMID